MTIPSASTIVHLDSDTVNGLVGESQFHIVADNKLPVHSIFHIVYHGQFYPYHVVSCSAMSKSAIADHHEDFRSGSRGEMSAVLNQRYPLLDSESCLYVIRVSRCDCINCNRECKMIGSSHPVCNGWIPEEWEP